MNFDPRRTIRYYWLKIIRLQGDPHVLARGVAIGIFIGVTPTIPFHTVLAIALALILRGSKITALLFTVIVSNPLTFFFQYYFSWRLGTLLTFRDLSWGKICSVLNIISANESFQHTIMAIGGLGLDTIFVMLIGGAVLALPFSLLGYLLSYFFFAMWQKKRKKSRCHPLHNSKDSQ